jgi:hypothetical protein
MAKKKNSCKEKKFKKVMKEFGKGKLKTSAGKKVKKLKMAQAIAFSESRRHCGNK